jgi:ribose transport system ATP-binding protein
VIESGEILLDGEPVQQLSPGVAWQQGIAYVPEERRTQGLVLGESVRANMLLPHLERIRFMQFLLDQRREVQIAEELGSAVRLKAVGGHQLVRELSGGNQQKTLFGRALVRQPRLLLLDEPTRGVDIGAKFDIYRMIRELSDQQISILMVSSELSELLGMCDRILIMRDRSIAGETLAAGLTEKDLLSLCYGYQKEGQS